MNKQELRKRMRALNLGVGELDRAMADSATIQHEDLFFALEEARVVAVFSPLPDEPKLDSFVQFTLLDQGYRVVVPRVEGDVMNFYDYEPDKMVVTEPYGIAEPGPDATLCLPEDIDVMIVPGVAFTRHGDRLGRGKGYYDRYLSQPGFRAMTFGFCYPHQMFLKLPTDPHDVRVDKVIVAYMASMREREYPTS